MIVSFVCILRRACWANALGAAVAVVSRSRKVVEAATSGMLNVGRMKMDEKSGRVLEKVDWNSLAVL